MKSDFDIHHCAIGAIEGHTKGAYDLLKTISYGLSIAWSTLLIHFPGVSIDQPKRKADLQIQPPRITLHPAKTPQTR